MINEDSKCKEPSFRMKELENFSGTPFPYSNDWCKALQQDSRLKNCSMLPFYGLPNGDNKTELNDISHYFKKKPV